MNTTDYVESDAASIIASIRGVAAMARSSVRGVAVTAPTPAVGLRLTARIRAALDADGWHDVPIDVEHRPGRCRLLALEVASRSTSEQG